MVLRKSYGISLFTIILALENIYDALTFTFHKLIVGGTLTEVAHFDKYIYICCTFYVNI